MSIWPPRPLTSGAAPQDSRNGPARSGRSSTPRAPPWLRTRAARRAASWSDGGDGDGSGGAALTPALWVLLWIGGASGYLIGLADGPGAAFEPSAWILEGLGEGGFQGPPILHAGPMLAGSCREAPHRVQLYTTIKPAAAAVAALATAFLSRRAGRKDTVAAGCLVYMVACALQAVTTPTTLYLGRAINGMATGALLSVYVSAAEVFDKERRGQLSACDVVGRGMGVLSQGLLMYGLQAGGAMGWSVYSMFSALCALFVFLVMTAGGLVDTPASLAQRGRFEEARGALQTLRGPLHPAKTEAEFQALAQECAHSMRQQTRTTLERRWRPRLVVALVLAASYNLTGGVLVKFNMPVILTRMIATETVRWMYLMYVLLQGCGSLLGAIVATLIIDRVGRVRSLAALFALNTFLLLGGGLLTATGYSYETQAGRALICVGLGLVAAIHAAGPQCIMFVYTSEVQPLATRSLTFGLAVAANEAGQALVELTALRRGNCYSTAHNIFPMVFTSLLVLALVLALLPETARLDSAGIDAAFDAHWLWRRFAPPAHARPAARERDFGGAGRGGSS